MDALCPLCGAQLRSDETCSDWFYAAQIKEIENPDTYYRVHHLSVPCYLLQHNFYSRPGWLAVYRLLHEFVYDGLTPAAARRRLQRPMGSDQRQWSLVNGPKLPGVEDIAWSFTIAEVRLDTAEHYQADVRAWAEAVLADSAELVAQNAEAA
jgi:hypothetical protein